MLWRDGVDGERQREAESDVVDGMPAGAEINNHHRGSADKYRFNTSGYQVGETGQKVWGVATTNTFMSLLLPFISILLTTLQSAFKTT